MSILNKHKSNPTFNPLFRLISVLSVVLFAAFGYSTSVQGAFSSGRYNDALNNPHQEAVYEYKYENTSDAAAPGYYEIALEALANPPLNPQDQIQINSITSAYPLDATTFAPIVGTVTDTYVVSQASFVDTSVTPNILRIRFVPQKPCTVRTTAVAADPLLSRVAQPVGSCAVPDTTSTVADANYLIPQAVPGKITIKASLKTTSPVTPSTIDASLGNIFFPNGFPINAIGWRISAAYVKTDDVLDPNATPVATIKGQGGNGNPIVGSPYTVVVSNIKAVTGNNLIAPLGTCTTTVSSVLYTGTNITNGVCTINITANAPATIAAGTANISDGGSPIAITKNNIPYTGVTSDSYLTSTDIPGLTVSCNSATVNATTTCSFTLPANKLLPLTPNLLIFGINDGVPAGVCTATGSNVSCTGVPTGTTTGSQPIFGQVGATAKVATGESVLIGAADITTADIAGITFTCNITSVSSVTACSFVLPPNKSLPSNFKIGLGDAVLAQVCTASGSFVTCLNSPSGSVMGNQVIFGQIGTGVKTDTGEKTYIIPSENLHEGDLTYNPGQGSTAPLFRSSDPTTITLNNFKTILDPNPVNGVYVCKFEARPFQANSSTAAWTSLGTNIAYTSANGCSVQFTKTIRGTGLSWSVRAVVSKVLDATQTFELRDSYIFRFQGAGIASGG